MILPAAYQPPLPLDRLLLPVGAPGAGDRMELDVLIVGAGPAGLACAIELAHLAQRERNELTIGVLEKAEALGEHSLSGAVVNPRAFRELFPDLKDADFPFRAPVKQERVALLTSRRAFTLPTPPTMHNTGNYVASLCEIVRWLGQRAAALGVNIFTGFPAASLLVDGERVAGVRTAATGLDREGRPLANYLAPNDLIARVTALAEGTRGSLSQAWLAWRGVTSENPQTFALGVKEIWETRRPLDTIVHTQREDLRSEEHTSELQSRLHLVCRLLLEKKKKQTHDRTPLINVLIRRGLNTAFKIRNERKAVLRKDPITFNHASSGKAPREHTSIIDR